MLVTYEAIRSVEDLLSVAEAMERDSADRYRRFAADLRKRGDESVAAEFEALAALEDRHVGEVAARAHSVLGKPAGPLPVGWRLPPSLGDEEARGALLNAYQALAFAVRNEERAFAFYTYVAAAAGNQAVRRLAEDLARDELEHASRLRRLRRRAFHQDRPAKLEIPTSVERLSVLVRQWEKSAALAHARLADRAEQAGRQEEAEIFRRLAAEEDAAAVDAPIALAPPLVSAAEGLRLVEETFDRLTLIAERAKDERVLAEAQRLAEGLIARLALAGEAVRAIRSSARSA
jgi:rubrerythrin